MRIQFTVDGGFAAFPGLSQPVTIDTTTLPSGEAATLEGLVTKARFFEQPEHASVAPPGAADYRQYTITVEDGSRRHTVQLDEPISDPDLAELVAQLQARARRRSGGSTA